MAQLLLGRAIRHVSPPGAIAAVHGQKRAGNVLSARGTQIKDSIGDFISLATPSPGNRLEERGAKLLVHPWSTLWNLRISVDHAGAMQLTLIRCSASSMASTFVNITTPAFDAQYADAPKRP